MKHQVLFGLDSNYKDEKKIVQNIKNYLAQFSRDISTVKSGDRLKSHLPFKIKQFHWNLNKSTGTYIELFPNQDLDGRFFVENRPNLAWLIIVLFHYDSPGYEKDKSEKFIKDLLGATNYKYELIFETDDCERIEGGFEI